MSTSVNQTEPQSSQKPEDKKPYTPPKLTHHKSIYEQTLNTILPGGSDSMFSQNSLS